MLKPVEPRSRKAAIASSSAAAASANRPACPAAFAQRATMLARSGCPAGAGASVPRVVGFGPADVKRERAGAGENEEGPRLRLHLAGLLLVARGAGECARLLVVVSDDLGEILDALAGLLLEPGGGGSTRAETRATS